jgi:hypothetical protein
VVARPVLATPAAAVDCGARLVTAISGRGPGALGWNARLHDQVQSSPLTPASLAMACHFGISAAMKAARSSGVPGRAAAASCLKRACVCGEASPALIAALSLPMMSFGVPAGATTLVQELAMKSGKPLSIIVGTCGSSGRRTGVAVASALILLSLRWPNSTEVVSKPA